MPIGYEKLGRSKRRFGSPDCEHRFRSQGVWQIWAPCDGLQMRISSFAHPSQRFHAHVESEAAKSGVNDPRPVSLTALF